MSLITVQNKILDTFQKNATLDALFADALAGTATSDGVNIAGVGTAFTTEVEVGDYIGNPTAGYRKVLTVPSDEALTVKSAFDVPLVGVTIKNTHIRKGFQKNSYVTKVGRTCSLAFRGGREHNQNCPNTRVWAEYIFTIVFVFTEPDPDTAEERIGTYDKAIRDIIDANPTFGDVVHGELDTGHLQYIDNTYADGFCYGTVALLTRSLQTRGNR